MSDGKQEDTKTVQEENLSPGKTNSSSWEISLVPKYLWVIFLVIFWQYSQTEEWFPEQYMDDKSESQSSISGFRY